MQIPKIKLEDFRKFLTNEMIVAVGSAILLTPFLIAQVEGATARFPFLKDHLTLALVIVSFLVFIFAIHVKGIFGAILVGIAGGILITGLEPTFQNFNLFKVSK